MGRDRIRVLDGQVLQHQVVAALHQEDAAAAGLADGGAQGRTRRYGAAGTGLVGVVVRVGDDALIPGRPLDGDVVLVAEEKQFLVGSLPYFDGDRIVFLHIAAHIAEGSLDGAEVAGAVGSHLECGAGRGRFHRKRHIVLSDGLPGDGRIDRHIIGLPEGKRLVVELDLQRLALDPQRRIMDDAVLAAVERVQEGVERRVIVDGDLAGVGIGPLGDHGAVGEDIDLGDVRQVDLVHQGAVGLEHLHETGSPEGGRRIESDDQRRVHAQDRGRRIGRNRFRSLRRPFHDSAVGRCPAGTGRAHGEPVCGRLIEGTHGHIAGIGRPFAGSGAILCQLPFVGSRPLDRIPLERQTGFRGAVQFHVLWNGRNRLSRIRDGRFLTLSAGTDGAERQQCCDSLSH